MNKAVGCLVWGIIVVAVLLLILTIVGTIFDHIDSREVERVADENRARMSVQDFLSDIENKQNHLNRLSKEFDIIIERSSAGELSELDTYISLRQLHTEYDNLATKILRIDVPRDLTSEIRSNLNDIRYDLSSGVRIRANGIENLMDYIDTGSMKSLADAQDNLERSIRFFNQVDVKIEDLKK